MIKIAIPDRVTFKQRKNWGKNGMFKRLLRNWISIQKRSSEVKSPIGYPQVLFFPIPYPDKYGRRT